MGPTAAARRVLGRANRWLTDCDLAKFRQFSHTVLNCPRSRRRQRRYSRHPYLNKIQKFNQARLTHGGVKKSIYLFGPLPRAANLSEYEWYVSVVPEANIGKPMAYFAAVAASLRPMPPREPTADRIDCYD